MNYDLPKSKIVYNLTIKLNLYINNDYILINKRELRITSLASSLSIDISAKQSKEIEKSKHLSNMIYIRYLLL